jgi:hypothetical protein
MRRRHLDIQALYHARQASPPGLVPEADFLDENSRKPMFES